MCAGVYESHCDPVRDAEAIAPDVATGVNPQPFLPLLAPSPLTPFTNNSVPALSGTRSNVKNISCELPCDRISRSLRR